MVIMRGARAGRGLLGALVALGCVALAGCSEPSGDGGERGRQIYLGQCVACHNPDPALAGPLGPPIKGVSREVLEAKILKGTYPPGYTPKRPTALMPPQPALAPEIESLSAFLR